MPNNSYTTTLRGLFYFNRRDFFTVHTYGIGKKANSAYVCAVNRACVRIVWRQSEFAFFVRYFGWRTFLFETIFTKNLVYWR